MDYGNDKPWNWNGDDYFIEKDPDLQISQFPWNGVPINEEDPSYMFDETTPVKACGDLAYHASVSGNINKEMKVCGETSSQVKRRRMLQFNSQVVDPSTSREELSPEFIESKNSDDPKASRWDSVCSGFSDNVSVSCYESLDQSPEGWISECFDDPSMQFNLDELNFPGASDYQFDLSEICDMPPKFEADTIQQSVTQTPRKIVFKGKKSYIRTPTKLASSVAYPFAYIRTPTKLASSVAYPFAFIKPCGVQGDVTLKDINQRIRTPPPSKLKSSEENPSSSFPTSAFSGKPVVVKTKIHTDGGKGSITITRTKG